MKHLRPLLCALPLILAGQLDAAPAKRPNLIIILSDDMGYSDLGSYGGEIATPNLDQLARDGVRFTQFYNAARCCPSRASLLTGLYPHQAGIGHMVENRGFEAYRGNLNRQSVTLAEVLKPSGYRTYAVGKWHVTPGKTPAALADKANWPLQRGFDRFYGTINGSGSFWDPNSLVRDNREITAAGDRDYRPEEYYYTDAISDHSTRFIREHATDHAQEPFLLYVAYTAAHWPMHARERDIAKYRGRYDRGYGPVAAARGQKQLQLGVASPAWGLPLSAEDWSQVKDPAFEARGMEVYAAMVEVMDEGIGRIIAELRAQGQLDNTFICFLQDNGGCAETNGRTGAFQARGEKPSLPPLAPDIAQYGNAPKQTRDGWPVRDGYGVLPGPADTFVAYGRGWANVSTRAVSPPPSSRTGLRAYQWPDAARSIISRRTSSTSWPPASIWPAPLIRPSSTARPSISWKASACGRCWQERPWLARNHCSGNMRAIAPCAPASGNSSRSTPVTGSSMISPPTARSSTTWPPPNPGGSRRWPRNGLPGPGASAWRLGRPSRPPHQPYRSSTQPPGFPATGPDPSSHDNPPCSHLPPPVIAGSGR
jgi:arylsulfatase A-like enzyme